MTADAEPDDADESADDEPEEVEPVADEPDDVELFGRAAAATDVLARDV